MEEEIYRGAKKASTDASGDKRFYVVLWGIVKEAEDVPQGTIIETKELWTMSNTWQIIC